MASHGTRVCGLDFDAQTIALLAAGKLPVAEPGLEELLKQGVATGRLTLSRQPEEAVQGIEVLWIAYDTPVDEDDNAQVDYVLDQILRTIPHLPQSVTVLISSQLPVGSIRKLEAITEQQFPEKDLSFACSPENLRLGKAIDVFLRPDRIIVGVRSDRDKMRLTKLLNPITDRIEWMSVESAEMTKHAINAFLATSITFTNEIASLCEKTGADAKEVERGLKTEARIGSKAYVAPGAAFAGGTLARDVAFLSRIGEDTGLRIPLLAAIRPSNEEHKQWVYRKLEQLFPGLRTKVAIWGLTYKPGTDTLRRSMAVELCRWLLQRGAQVAVHDPAVKQTPEEFKSLKGMQMFAEPIAALEGAQSLVISTEWPQFKEITAERIAAAAPGLVVLDANRFLPMLARASGLRYMAVGTPE
jgi:UDPglucose 6-dehydrogenase